VNGYGELTIPNTTFGQMTTVDDTKQVFNGIFGAAFAALANSGALPPLVNAVQQGILRCPIFETYFKTEGKEFPASTWSGFITFGGFDTANCGEHTFVPLLEIEYYLIGVDSLSVGSKLINGTFTKGIMDTGAPLITGPKVTVDAIAAAVGATYDATKGIYTIGCTATYDPVIFTINGQQYSLGPSILTMNTNGNTNGQCLFGMDAAEYGPTFHWLIGSVFNRAYCLLHDLQNGQIGIAKPLH